MNEDVQMVMDMARESMDSSMAHLEKELTKIRAGKANPSMLDTVAVDYYGNMSPLSQIANVNTLDPHTLSVQPWDKSSLEAIENAIRIANLGLNPQNNGEMIIISVPALTEERRRDFVKQAKNEGENAKVGIRSSRKDANDEIKSLEDAGLSEDQRKDAEAGVQKLTDEYSAKIDNLVAAKEKDVMTV